MWTVKNRVSTSLKVMVTLSKFIEVNILWIFWTNFRATKPVLFRKIKTPLVQGVSVEYKMINGTEIYSDKCLVEPYFTFLYVNCAVIPINCTTFYNNCTVKQINCTTFYDNCVLISHNCALNTINCTIYLFLEIYSIPLMRRINKQINRHKQASDSEYAQACIKHFPPCITDKIDVQQKVINQGTSSDEQQIFLEIFCWHRVGDTGQRQSGKDEYPDDIQDLFEICFGGPLYFYILWCLYFRFHPSTSYIVLFLLRSNSKNVPSKWS